MPVIGSSRNMGQMTKTLKRHSLGHRIDQCVHHCLVFSVFVLLKTFFACTKAFFKKSFSIVNRPIMRSNSAILCSVVCDWSVSLAVPRNAPVGLFRNS